MNEQTPSAVDTRHIFDVTEADLTYRLYLPNHETDHIQRGVAREGGPYERGMLQDMAGRLRPGDIAIDVGANVGNHTIYLAYVCSARVWAFEPSESLAKAIRTSAELNDVDELVEVRQIALGSERGQGYLILDDASNLGEGHVEATSGDPGSSAVRMERLDDVGVPPGVALVKIDVEGMELKVLRGASELIDRDRPVLYVEARGRTEFEQVNEWLGEHDYVYWRTYNHTATNVYVPVERVASPQWLERMHDAAMAEYTRRDVEQSTKDRLSRLDQERAALTAAVDGLRVEVGALERGRDELLARTAARTQELATELAAAQRRSDALRASVSFRLGESLKDAARRPYRIPLLPVTWWRIVRGRSG
jgi:FkbM family methyltransferase